MPTVTRQRLLDIANLFILALKCAGYEISEMLEDNSTDSYHWKEAAGHLTITIYDDAPEGDTWSDPDLELQLSKDGNTFACFNIALGWEKFRLREEAGGFTDDLEEIDGWEIKFAEQRGSDDLREAEVPIPMMLRAILLHLRHHSTT